MANKFSKKNITYITRALLLVLVVLSVAFSFYASLELFEHDCSGEDCPVCNFIFVCRTALKIFSVTLAFSVGLLTFPAIKTLCFSHSVERKVSPVCLGVRLNN